MHQHDAAALKEHGIEFNASFILGGQVRGEPPRLFSIYAAGNFIEATLDTPYFQIGEAKYGKPIIDRVVTRSSSLAEAAKCALISMDSTIRSNLSVGPPLDLLCFKRDTLRVLVHRNITADDAYFRMIRSGWSDSLRHAFHALPNPELQSGERPPSIRSTSREVWPVDGVRRATSEYTAGTTISVRNTDSSVP